MENFEDQINQVEVEKKTEVGLDKTKLILPGAILLSALMISGSVVFYSLISSGNLGANIKQANNVVGSKINVSIDDDAILGDPKAKVTIVEFSDFQCPFCRRFWKDTLPQIKKEYIDTGKARFIYRDYPLSFHPGAQVAAEATECAKEQGKYWEMHDKIFEEQEKKGQGTIQFGASDLKTWASKIGVDVKSFNQCLDAGKYKAEVEKDFADGSSYGVSGTPTTYVNGKPMVGALQFSAFKTAIDLELK